MAEKGKKRVLPNKPLEIEKEKVLLVEGKDEEAFFSKLMEGLNLAAKIQVISIGGVDQMKSNLEVFRLAPGFEGIRSLGIVRDADNSLSSAVQSVRTLLENNDLPSPTSHNTFTQREGGIKVGIFVMPGTNIEGEMLEDLCLKTVENESHIPLIDQYFEKFNENNIDLPSNLAKAKVQVFLASQRRIVTSLGLGAQRNYWNLDHTCLDDIKNFLQSL